MAEGIIRMSLFFFLCQLHVFLSLCFFQDINSFILTNYFNYVERTSFDNDEYINGGLYVREVDSVGDESD